MGARKSAKTPVCQGQCDGRVYVGTVLGTGVILFRCHDAPGDVHYRHPSTCILPWSAWLAACPAGPVLITPASRTMGVAIATSNNQDVAVQVASLPV